MVHRKHMGFLSVAEVSLLLKKKNQLFVMTGLQGLLTWFSHNVANPSINAPT